MNMIERLAFVGIALLGSIVALPPIRNDVAQTSYPAPPPVIPAWILGGGKFYPCCYDVDPGATADQSLFAGVLDGSTTTDDTLKTNCPGIGSGGSNVSNCNPYKYVNMLYLICDDTLESMDAYNYLNNGAGAGAPDETGFVHEYAMSGPTPTPAPRVTDGGNCPSPNPTPTPTTGPYPSAGYYTNPDDTAFQSWLVSHVWTTSESNFPPPYGVFEDHFSVVGDAPCYNSYEYGRLACSNRGNSASPAPHDWETALGDFENNAEANCSSGTCFAFVGNGLTPGGGNNTNSCSHVNAVIGQCFATFDAGVVNDMDALDNLCSAADSGGHLQAIAAEEIVFLKGIEPAPNPSPFYANTQTIVYMINTMSHLVNYPMTSPCATTVAIDVESSGGSFPDLLDYAPGTVTAGIPIRQEATALRFLVPDPMTYVPDRMQPFYYTVGGTANNWTPTADHCTITPYCEVPYFFEETIVPQGQEVTVGAFHWNGATQSVGDGCPAPTPNPPDTGGAVDLMVACVDDPDSSTDGAAVFRQEYHHLYIDGNDYGPAAVLLNTASETSVNIDSSWFECSGCDHIGKFGEQLKLKGGELKSVFYNGGSISLECTASYCNGDKTVSGNTTAFSYNPMAPPTIGPDSGIILLGSN
jgi:hypothetical protein